MLKTNSKQAIENVRAYIIDSATTEPEDVADKFEPSVKMLKTGKDLETGRDIDKFSVAAWLIYSVFKDEYHYQIGRFTSEESAFESWTQGLPNALDCSYYLHSAAEDLGRILEETDAEKSRFSEQDAERLLTHLIYREIKKQIERRHEQ